MSAMSNTSSLCQDPLDRIFERLDGTVATVSQLRKCLGDLEKELSEIHQQYRIWRGREQKWEQGKLEGGRCTETSGPQQKSDPKFNSIRKVAGLFKKSEPRSHFTSLISGGPGSPAGRILKGGNSSGVSRSKFTTTPVANVQDVATPEPTPKHAQEPPIASQYPPRPPTQISPFPTTINPSSYHPELKHEGDDWFVVCNPSPKVKRVLDVNLVHTLMHGSPVRCVKFSQDGKWLATGCRRTAHIYDVKTGLVACILDHENDEYVESLSFSSDGKYLATSGDDNQIRVWDIINKQIHNIFKGHQGTIFSLHFSLGPNGQCIIISGSRDGTVRIWDVHNQTSKVLTIESHYLSHCKASSVASSADGRYIAMGLMDTVGIWETETGGLVQTLRGHRDVVRSVVFTPDGKGLISGSWDATLKYWDVSGLSIGSGASASTTLTLPCTMSLTSHDQVYSTAISRDGTWLVSGSYDPNILFWDARTGVAQCLLSGHRNRIYGVDLSPTENLLATSSADRQVRIWTYRAFP